MSEGAKRAAQRMTKEDFEETLAQLNKPVELGVALGDWISARDAKAIVERISETSEVIAITALCRRAVIAVPVRASTFSRGEEPHEYIDRFDFFEGREPDLSHFMRTVSPEAFEEIRGFFEELGGSSEGAATGVDYAIWGTGDFKVTVPMDFSDVTLTVVGPQFDRRALLRSLGEEPQLPDTPAIAVPFNSGGRPARRHGAPLFPPTQIGLGKDGGFAPVGLRRGECWQGAGPIRDIFRNAFEAAGLPYFNPHSLRDTLVQLGEQVCTTPEQFKA